MVRGSWSVKGEIIIAQRIILICVVKFTLHCFPPCHDDHFAIPISTYQTLSTKNMDHASNRFSWSIKWGEYVLTWTTSARISKIKKTTLYRPDRNSGRRWIVTEKNLLFLKYTFKVNGPLQKPKKCFNMWQKNRLAYSNFEDGITISPKRWSFNRKINL